MFLMVSIILASLYLYFVFQIGSIQKGIMKNSVMFVLLILCTVIGGIASRIYIGCLVATILLLLFDLFYDEESFFLQWKWILGFGSLTSGLFLIHRLLQLNNESAVIIGILLGMYLLLVTYRKMIKTYTTLLMIFIYIAYLYLVYALKGTNYASIIVFLVIGTFFAFEMLLTGYRNMFERKTVHFQQELLINQYEEVKNIYLNMRGFRHDYHNHLQAIKAYLYMNQIEEAHTYLIQLEGELERIDSSVRSGNLMIDAILNSKIAVAEKHEIQVVCKAEVPEVLSVTDIDLCVILGNLLDNAIESCQKIKENRFIRIYIAVIKEQLYFSIQNAAKEELDFNEKHYISTKRGNHGLGMKRVEVLVNKYEGYLNLQNEPGIFAAEVTFRAK